MNATVGIARNEARTAVFFGGCIPASAEEEQLAYGIGGTLATRGFAVLHGGYNGLMEHAARGSAERGGQVVAVTLEGVDWGPFNPYVHAATYQPTMGARMHTYLDAADIIVAMAGGIGTLHELTAAIWYAGNIRPVPVVVAGATAQRLLAFLRTERWIYTSPTRPLDFLHEIDAVTELDRLLVGLAVSQTVGSPTC